MISLSSVSTLCSPSWRFSAMTSLACIRAWSLVSSSTPTSSIRATGDQNHVKVEFCISISMLCFDRISVVASIYMIISVGIERYLAVCRPHHFRQVQTQTYRWVLRDEICHRHPSHMSNAFMDVSLESIILWMTFRQEMCLKRIFPEWDLIKRGQKHTVDIFCSGPWFTSSPRWWWRWWSACPASWR